MKIVIINLKKSKKRFQKISNNLNELGIPFERFDAIYGKEMSKEDIKNNTTFLGRNLFCNHGMIGCAMSHLTVWKNFKQSRDKFILISEDDVEYKKDFLIFLKNIEKIYNETHFDFLSLNDSVGVYNSFHKSIIVDKYELSKPIFPFTMASYILSRKGVYKLLRMIQKINYHIDFEIAFKKMFCDDLEYYYLKEPKILEVSYTTDSNIISDNNGFLNYLLELLRLKKINWLISNTVFTLFLKKSISIYCCIIVLLIIFCILKKNYLLSIVLLVEFFLINF